MAFPVIFGFTVYEGFERIGPDGKLNLPGPDESTVGGHAVLCVGYNDKTKRFIIRNSYGPDFGMSGYFTMPYKYLEDPGLSADFWTIELME
jgi:C1A family cysteine protease